MSARKVFARIANADSNDRARRCARGDHGSVLRSRSPHLDSVCLDCRRPVTAKW